MAESALLLYDFVSWLTMGSDHEWMETWNGDPAGKLGTKQQTVGRPNEAWEWEISEASGQRWAEQ